MLFLYSLVFLCGAFSAHCLPQLPNYKILSILILLLLIIWPRNKYLIHSVFYLVGLTLGSYNIYNLAHEQWLISFLYHKPISLTGTVQSIDPNYAIKLDEINKALKLNYSYLNLYYDDLVNLKQNQKVFIKTKLQPRRFPINFITNSKFGNQYQKNILKGVSIKEIEILADNTTARQNLWDSFLHYSQNLTNNGLILAFLFGETGFLTDQQTQSFLSTGTGHLIAISGMHITLVYMLVNRALRFIWFKQLYCFRVSKNAFSLIISWFVTVLYCFLAGFSVPIQRAVIAISTFTFSKLMHWKMHSFNVFGLCIFFVLFYDSSSVVSPSFWLSFMATFWLLYMYSNDCHKNSDSDTKHEWVVNKIKKYFIAHSEVCTKIFIALIPITIFYFNKLSMIHIMANIIAIPVIDLLTIPLLLCVLFLIMVNNLFMFAPLDYLIDVCLFWVNLVLEKLVLYLVFLQNYLTIDFSLLAQNYFYYNFF